MAKRKTTGMFEVSVRSHFSAAHHLRGYQGTCESPHGHNWEVELFVRGRTLNPIGILVDFRVLKDALKQALGPVDHVDLNRLRGFSTLNPTSENIAQYLYRQLSKALNCPAYKVSRILVRETPETGASYSED